MGTKDWIKNNLIVGPYPYKVNNNINISEYDIVINVSDEYYPEIKKKIVGVGCDYYWFPMNECTNNIGLNSIYGAMNILWEAELNNKKVYLHCHLGVNRSQLVYDSYYYGRFKEHFIENKDDFYYNQIDYNCSLGKLPKQKEYERFLTHIIQKLYSSKERVILDFVLLKNISL